MRISMVSEHASPLAALGGVDAGGQNVHVAALSAALARRGHSVSVYTRRDDPLLPARVIMRPGVEVVHVNAGPPEPVPKDELLPFMGQLADGISADWADVLPDVVHAHFWMSGVAALDAARRPGSRRVPVLQTFHALGTVKRRHQGAQDTSPVQRAWLEPSVGREVDRIIATCSDEVFELAAMGIPRGNVSIAPCGVDVGLFTPDGEAEPRGRTHRIVTLGRLVPRKGTDLAVRTLRLLKDQGIDDVELLVVGGASGAAGLAADPEAQRLRGLARELGVEDQLVFRGQLSQEQIPSVLRSADVVICAPWYEPFGIVPLEAMACGVPVVAASVGGLIDTVVDRKTGLHVPPRDAEAVADAVAELLANPQLRRELGRAGRQRARTRYSWDRVAADTEKAYHLAISKGAEAVAAGARQLEGEAL
jgi:D-inositol-3-phosphate glycosyltransferase